MLQNRVFHANKTLEEFIDFISLEVFFSNFDQIQYIFQYSFIWASAENVSFGEAKLKDKEFHPFCEN